MGDHLYRLMTVAHAFALPPNTKSYEKAFFIPAMIDDDDRMGENYGVFEIEGNTLHPNYRVDDVAAMSPAHDICTVAVGKGSMYDTIEDANLQLIRCVAHGAVVDPKSRWEVIGYSGSYGNKMMTIIGEYHLSAHPGSVVHMNREVTHGMSGGPWITDQFHSTKVANGVQAGNSTVIPGTGVSPHFDNMLFRKVNYVDLPPM